MSRRSVSLLLGKRSYSFTTSLEDERLSEVYDLLRGLMDETDRELEQDERLFLTCMVLANELAAVADRISKISASEELSGEHEEEGLA